MDNIKIIRIEGRNYLGELQKDAIVKAYDFGEGALKEEHLVEWLKADNLEELETIKICGDISYTIKELNITMSKKFKIKSSEFDYIKEKALRMLENSYLIKDGEEV